jgi:putative ABC transport system permease protein
MTLTDTFSLSWRNLRQSKLRTCLTTLGVAIGIASLAGMVSLGVGLQEQLTSRFVQSGVFDTITVTSSAVGGIRGPGGLRGGQGGQGDDSAPPRQLEPASIEEIRALEHVRDVYPSVRFPVEASVEAAGSKQGFAASGVPMSSKGEGVFQTFSHGGFFSSESAAECMLSLDAARRINRDNPGSLVGSVLKMTYAASQSSPLAGAAAGEFQIRRVERDCTLVGIVERSGGGLIPGDGGLLLPLPLALSIDAEIVTNAQSMLRQSNEPRRFSTLTVKVDQPQNTQDVQDSIRRLGYTVFSASDALAGARNAFIILDIVLGLVGSIALAVSSLGIVNTMVMSILERTREIGIMKAIGAGNRDIRRIFLLEASAIGLLGGALGIALGWLVGKAINLGANLYIQNQGGTPGTIFSLPLWLVAGSIGFSILVSLAAGIYPAARAARLDPIQALRHD